MHELLTGAAAKQPQRATDNVPFRRPQWAGSDWHPKASLLPSAHSKAASKGTGVFLPYNYDDPVAATLDLQPLDWSHMYSSSLHASRDNASPRSELSRIDSSFSCQSSETDCSFIAAHGLSIPSKFPAGKGCLPHADVPDVAHKHCERLLNMHSYYSSQSLWPYNFGAQHNF